MLCLLVSNATLEKLLNPEIEVTQFAAYWDWVDVCSLYPINASKVLSSKKQLGKKNHSSLRTLPPQIKSPTQLICLYFVFLTPFFPASLHLYLDTTTGMLFIFFSADYLPCYLNKIWITKLLSVKGIKIFFNTPVLHYSAEKAESLSVYPSACVHIQVNCHKTCFHNHPCGLQLFLVLRKEIFLHLSDASPTCTHLSPWLPLHLFPGSHRCAKQPIRIR